MRSFDQHLLHLVTNLVLEHNEGFQEDFSLGLAHGLEHPWKIRFAVFQQLDPVVALPAIVDIHHGGFAGGPGGG
ncbi:hypothetical protein D3C84_937390 [compost metagenome]